MKNDDVMLHLLNKLDSIKEDIAEIKLSQARTELDVAHHIKRTDLLEDMVKELKKIVDWLAAPIYLTRFVLKALRLIK